MPTLLRWLRLALVSLLVLALGSLALVSILRWQARTPEGEAAVALMEARAPASEGVNGFAWLAFPDQRIPEAELPAALAARVAEVEARQPAMAAGLLEDTEALVTGTYELPALSPAAATPGDAQTIPAKYPERPEVEVPEAACNWRDPDCLGKVRRDPDTLRAWLAADAERLALAERALAADHLDDPFPPTLDAPIPAYQMLRLPLTAAALQAVDGDLAGATARACTLWSAARRFEAGAGNLIGKMVNAILADGAGALVLALRREPGAAALPPACEPALAPVRVEDHSVCEPLRHEYRMGAALADQVQRAADGWHPRQLLHRHWLVDARLQKQWSAQLLAPACSDAAQAALARGETPPPAEPPLDLYSPDCFGAFTSCVLTMIAAPAYDHYQVRLLDHAARQRLLVAAVQAADGRIGAGDIATAGASPGYALSQRDGAWVLPMKSRNAADGPEFVLPAAVPAVAPEPASEPADG